MRKRSRWDFWEKVAKAGPDNCWPWQGHKTSQGYGRLTAEGRNWWAHRLAYESAKGSLPEWSFEAEVQHSCNNPCCCNPRHLWLGTRKDNMKTASEQGTLSRKGIKNGNFKLVPEQIIAIREDKRPSRAVAKDYGVEKTQILRIRKGIHWSHT